MNRESKLDRKYCHLIDFQWSEDVANKLSLLSEIFLETCGQIALVILW